MTNHESGKGEELLVQAEYLLQPDPEARQPSEQVQQQPSQGGGKKKKRGQNKKRPPPVKFDRSQRLCPVLVDFTFVDNPDPETRKNPECLFPNCQFIHDLSKYLEDKDPDIGSECHVFRRFGRCPRGLTCRFGTEHIIRETLGEEGTEWIYNKVDHDKVQSQGQCIGQERNHLNQDLKVKLRKNQVDFKQSDDIVETCFKQREAEREENDGDLESKAKKAKLADVVIPDEIKAKKIDWKDKLYLAPLTTVGNLPFRRICKEFGADITCGEMAMGLPILQGHQPEWALLQRHSSEDVFGIQICGSNPNQMTRVASLVEAHVDCDFVDLNLGCPIDLVYQKGMGSGLMARKKPLEVMIRAMTQVLTRPLTVKMRTGIYMDKKIAHNLIPMVREWGADMVTLHGRSREQRYTRLADWKYIGECVEAASPMPLYGNGDVMSFEDYNQIKASSKVSGVMIARGALIKPWIFKEIKEQQHYDISSSERLDMVHKYCKYGLEHWGSDSKGVENTRRFLLEWLSFLHRYVPHGILLEPPQRINQRIPKSYKGRDDMETLLASNRSSDWVKITEMFLGKALDNFGFEPKHRANSY